jgi:hypothetical protein
MAKSGTEHVSNAKWHMPAATALSCVTACSHGRGNSSGNLPTKPRTSATALLRNRSSDMMPATKVYSALRGMRKSREHVALRKRSIL